MHGRHWVEKNCYDWAVAYIKSRLTGLKVAQDDMEASVVSVKSVTGDCDLNQRKGKLIHIYDLAMKLEWAGKSNQEGGAGHVRLAPLRPCHGSHTVIVHARVMRAS